jgi:hypothetical protein
LSADKVKGPALQIAISRLSEAEVRRNDRDKIIDAVVGMEPILLAAVGNEAYRGELRFRFALHYALLSSGDDGRERYRLALSLYDLRSKIAHGGTVGGTIKLNDEKMTLARATAIARDVLRTLIMHFVEMPVFLAAEAEYWQSLYFGQVRGTCG